jgi:hypothetical protein
MKVAAYTIGDIERASSRLRSFYLFSHAKEYGLYVSRPSGYCEALNFDVVHIQKLLSYKLILWVLIYRIFGLKVVFDIDDQPTGVESFMGYLLILSLSSVITVDTEARKNFWGRYLFFKRIVVIYDIADTDDIELLVKKRFVPVNKTSFFWIGYSCNLQSLNGFIACLKYDTSYKLTVSLEANAIKSLRATYPFINFFPWFDGIAFDDCIEARFMVLNHNFDKASILKSENKMVLAILAGFVPIVSRTAAYEKLALTLDAEFLLFDDIEEVAEIASVISEKDFDEFFLRAVKYINLNYSRNAVLSDFNKTVLLR